jgi:hypothetical protein
MVNKGSGFDLFWARHSRKLKVVADVRDRNGNARAKNEGEAFVPGFACSASLKRDAYNVEKIIFHCHQSLL